MLWWQWVLAIGSFFGLLAFFLVYYVALLGGKAVKQQIPKILGIWLTNDGKERKRRAIKPIGYNGEAWFQECRDPRKIKYWLPAIGLGKAEMHRHNKLDTMEIPGLKPGTKTIIFNMIGWESRKAKWLTGIQSTFDRLIEQNINKDATVQDLTSNMESKVEQRAKDILTTQFTMNPKVQPGGKK